MIGVILGSVSVVLMILVLGILIIKFCGKNAQDNSFKAKTTQKRYQQNEQFHNGIDDFANITTEKNSQYSY